MAGEFIFKDVIKTFAEFMKWDTNEAISDDYAAFSFDLGEDNEVDLDFFLNEDRVDIAIVGQAYVESEADISDEFSTLLLRRSDDLMFGGWALAETEEGKLQYRLLWTVDLDYLASIKPERLQDLLEHLMDEAGEVNSLWEHGEF